MKIAVLTTFFALGLGFVPNQGPECKLTCKNRVSIRDCPAFHYSWGEKLRCSLTQYGCIDENRGGCGVDVHRPPLCVVDGPCGAGPGGCLEDKTGADDGLPPGSYVGHCPEPLTPEEECSRCRDDAVRHNEPGSPSFQYDFKHRCEGQCPYELFRKTQFFEAKSYCAYINEENDIGNNHFQQCLVNTLGSSMSEYERCYLQYDDTMEYCKELGYVPGENQSHQCLSTVLKDICPANLICEMQFETTATHCEKDKTPEGGPDYQKCLQDSLNGVCPKDTGCSYRFYTARGYCREKDVKNIGGSEYHKCVGDLLDATCPKDIGCERRYEDTTNYCKSVKGLDQNTPKHQECIGDILGKTCSQSSLCKSCHNLADPYCWTQLGTVPEWAAKCIVSRCNVTCPDAANTGNPYQDGGSAGDFFLKLQL